MDTDKLEKLIIAYGNSQYVCGYKVSETPEEFKEFVVMGREAKANLSNYILNENILGNK